MPSNVQFHSFKKKAPRRKGGLPRQDLGRVVSVATALNRRSMAACVCKAPLLHPWAQGRAPGRKPVGKASHPQDAAAPTWPWAFWNLAFPPPDRHLPC